MTQKLVNLKNSPILMGELRFKSASEFLEQYHSVVSFALKMEEPIWKNMYKFNKY
jgi:hypothetical protein